MAKHNEESDDKALDKMGAAAKHMVCRARYTDRKTGKPHICTRKKGHFTMFQANNGHNGPRIG